MSLLHTALQMMCFTIVEDDEDDEDDEDEDDEDEDEDEDVTPVARRTLALSKALANVIEAISSPISPFPYGSANVPRKSKFQSSCNTFSKAPGSIIAWVAASANIGSDLYFTIISFPSIVMPMQVAIFCRTKSC